MLVCGRIENLLESEGLKRLRMGGGAAAADISEVECDVLARLWFRFGKCTHTHSRVQYVWFWVQDCTVQAGTVLTGQLLGGRR